MTVNADLETKTHHQTPMTCTYRYSHFRHFQNCCNRDGNKNFKYMNYVPIVVATDLEVHFSVLKKGVSQYFCLYSVCTSHWCLVMSFWLKVCIYSHTRGVKLGLGLGFLHQVLPHWLNQSFSFFFLINNFFFFFTHNTISKIKQNKTADTYSTSQGSIKREGEREGQQEHKSYSFK